MSDNLCLCPICEDVYMLCSQSMCWRCGEQDQIDHDPNPPPAVDWFRTCSKCHWFLNVDGSCANPDCEGGFPVDVEENPYIWGE